MITDEGVLTPRPYARLLNMLSDQLIKDNTVALTELAKNSYDADADWVQIRVGNTQYFGKEKIPPGKEPYVEIQDNGDGMSLAVIKDAWMNPAAPQKALLKEGTSRGRTKRGRYLQGEKGIGRYAAFQIGQRVEIYSRPRKGAEGGGDEVYINTDLLKQPIKISSKDKKPGALFFDELETSYEVRDIPQKIIPETITLAGQELTTSKHGTLIRITSLRYRWTPQQMEKVRSALHRLQSPFRKQDFTVSIYFEGKEMALSVRRELKNIFKEAPTSCYGTVNDKGMCELSFNGEEALDIDLVELSLQDTVKENKYRFHDEDGERVGEPECGPFKFHFYAFDLRKLDKEHNQFVKDHRIYIYRDDIRVCPYGDPDNDWVKLDVYRGIVRASYYLSNNDVIGYVNVTSIHNPELIDKTSREGLVEQTGAFDDLRVLVLAALSMLKIRHTKALTKDQLRPTRRKERVGKLFTAGERVRKKMSTLSRYLEKQSDIKGGRHLNDAIAAYKSERELLAKQVDLVEDLAGVGIAVDATSHDVIVLMNRLIERTEEARNILTGDNPNLKILQARVEEVDEHIRNIQSLLVGIQPLFRSGRNDSRLLRVSSVIEKVERYYKSPILKYDIEVDIEEEGPPLKVRGSEGMLLQIFINLFDNAVFWLSTKKQEARKITIRMLGDEQAVIFADNGPGISRENEPYIFEPFFSTKGIDGRGLGLYIAQQLTDRYGFDLFLVESKHDQIAPGANFRLDFAPEDA